MANPETQTDPDAALDPALPQKKRARRRLVGAIALCLAALIVFPLLFDHEPHRGADDVKVQIPSRDAPLPGGTAPGAATSPGSSTPASPSVGAAPSSSASTPSGTSTSPSAGAPASSASPAAGGSAAKTDTRTESRSTDAKSTAKAESKAGARPDTKPESRIEARPEAKSESRPDARAEAKAAAKADADAKAAAKAEADARRREAKSASTDGKRYLLQVGAFATDKGAADQAEKVRASGLTVFTEKVRTAQGDRIRVRVGPFPSREQAEQARGQLKLVGIDSALIAP